MDILKQFGVDPILLVAQIVNFLIILFILKKFLYKPILELLNKRRTAIKVGLAQAEEARLKLEKVVAEEKQILKNAQLQARKIIEDAKQAALDTAQEIQEDSKKQTERMLNDAKVQIAREFQETEKRLAVNVSKIAVSFLQKSLEKFFSNKDQGEIMKEALMKIKKSN